MRTTLGVFSLTEVCPKLSGGRFHEPGHNPAVRADHPIPGELALTVLTRGGALPNSLRVKSHAPTPTLKLVAALHQGGVGRPGRFVEGSRRQSFGHQAMLSLPEDSAGIDLASTGPRFWV